MNLSKLKRTIAVSAFGLAAILGTSEVASAQNNRRITRRQERRIERRQERRAERR